VLALGIALSTCLPVRAARADTLCVNVGGVHGCHGTLAAAIEAASAGDIIELAGGTFLERVTIGKSLALLGAGAVRTILDGGQAGRVVTIPAGVTVIMADLTIRNGRTASDTAEDGRGVPGGGIHNAGNLTLIRCEVSANATGNGGRNGLGGAGGGIHNEGALVLHDSAVRNNVTGEASTGGPGGGISSTGSLRLEASTVSHNRTGYGYDQHGGRGAGIHTTGTLVVHASTIGHNASGSGSDYGGGEGGGLYTAGAAALTATTISHNTTGSGGGGGRGGGIFNRGALEVTASTISHNAGGVGQDVGGLGGGIYTEGSLALRRSTVSGNTVGDGFYDANGGGVYVGGGTADILNSTIAFNQITPQAAVGAGIAHAGGTVNLKNSIVAHNHWVGSPSAINDCSGTVVSQGYNFVYVPAGCALVPSTGDEFYWAPGLGPLQPNGGPTATHALAADSPAVDRADTSACGDADQRGLARPVDGDGDGTARCDVGAFEFGTPVAAVEVGGPAFGKGQTLTYEATLNPGVTSGPVDVYFGALLPDLVTFLSLVLEAGQVRAVAGPAPSPFLASASPGAVRMVQEHTFDSSEPLGTYFAYGAVVKAGLDPLDPANHLRLEVRAFHVDP
jgi:hypothetical protein